MNGPYLVLRCLRYKGVRRKELTMLTSHTPWHRGQDRGMSLFVNAH